MQIAVKGRGVTVDEDLRQRIVKRFEKVSKQVSELAELEVEIAQERNPAIAEKEIAEVTLRLKGVTLRACEHARDLPHAINLCADDLSRQVKRHRDRRRGRREARRAARASGLRPAL